MKSTKEQLVPCFNNTTSLHLDYKVYMSPDQPWPRSQCWLRRPLSRLDKAQVSLTLHSLFHRFIIDKLEVRKRELLLDKGRKFVNNRLCPMAYKDNELIDIPSHATSWHLGIVTFKLCILMFSLCLKVFFYPYLSVQMRIIDKGRMPSCRPSMLPFLIAPIRERNRWPLADILPDAGSA